MSFVFHLPTTHFNKKISFLYFLAMDATFSFFGFYLTLPLKTVSKQFFLEWVRKQSSKHAEKLLNMDKQEQEIKKYAVNTN